MAAHVFHHTFHAMGTRFSLVLPGTDRVLGESLANAAEAEVRAYEHLMSRYDVHSPLSDLNRRAALQPVIVPQALWDILAQCREHWQRSEGAFDIAQATLSELWRDSSQRNELPDGTAIAVAQNQSGFQHVQLNIETRAVSFSAPVRLDLGGIGKGIALESVASEFRRRGVSRAFFSFGESSITVLGSHPSGAAWPVGVADMFHPETSLHVFQLRDASVSTSGNAPAASGPAGHIIDVCTGALSTGYRTLSVASASAVEAEILSTALFATSENERAAILLRYPGVEAVEIVYESQVGDWYGKVNWRHES